MKNIISYSYLNLCIFMLIVSVSPLWTSELDTKINLSQKVSNQNGVTHGFYLIKEGMILTNYLIARNVNEITIHSKTSPSVKAILVRANKEEGYALFKQISHTSKINHPALGDSSTVFIGDSVYLDNKEYQIKGKLTKKRPYNHPCFLISKTPNIKDIGKPVLNTAGKIIGMFTLHQGVFFVLPINQVKPWIKNSLLRYQKKQSFIVQEEHHRHLIKEKINQTVRASNILSNTQHQDDDTHIAQHQDDDTHIAQHQDDDTHIAQHQDDDTPSWLISKIEKQIPQAIRIIGSNSDYNFGHIADLAFDQKYHLYLVDSLYGQIKRISPMNHALTQNKFKSLLAESRWSTITQSEPLKEPVSLAITKSNLIVVLDIKLQALCFFNKKLQLIDQFFYDEIIHLINPKKIRAVNNELFILSENGQIYHIHLNLVTKKLSISLLEFNPFKPVIATDLSQPINSPNSDTVFSYFDAKKSGIEIINWEKKQNIKSIPIPIHNLHRFWFYKGDFYLFDKINEKILIYTQDGKFLKSLDLSDLESQGNLSGVSISDNGLLALVYTHPNSIRIINLRKQSIERFSAFSNHPWNESPITNLPWPRSIEYIKNRNQNHLIITNESGYAQLISFKEHHEEKQEHHEEEQEHHEEEQEHHEEEQEHHEEEQEHHKEEQEHHEEEQEHHKEEQEHHKEEHEQTHSDKTDSNTLESQIRLLEPNASMIATGVSDQNKLFAIDTQNDNLLVYSVESILKNNQLHPKKLELRHIEKDIQVIQIAYFKGTLYLLDKKNNQIILMDKDGSLEAIYPTDNELGKRLYPQDITVDEKGNSFVLAENQVLTFSKEEKKLRYSFPIYEEDQIYEGTQTYLGYAKGITLYKDFLYITDEFNHRVLKFNKQGKLLRTFGKLGNALGEFNRPTDILAMGNHLFVVDTGNHRIVQYTMPEQTKKK